MRENAFRNLYGIFPRALAFKLLHKEISGKKEKLAFQQKLLLTSIDLIQATSDWHLA